MSVAAVAAAIVAGGCASSSATHWAQTAPTVPQIAPQAASRVAAADDGAAVLPP